jgi:hypothetical protein
MSCDPITCSHEIEIHACHLLGLLPFGGRYRFLREIILHWPNV